MRAGWTSGAGVESACIDRLLYRCLIHLYSTFVPRGTGGRANHMEGRAITSSQEPGIEQRERDAPRRERDARADDADFIPALGFHRLTPLFDMVAAVAVRDRAIKRRVLGR